MIRMQVTGDAATLRKLNALAGTPGRRAIRKAVNAGGTPFSKAVKRLLPRGPYGTGALKKAITKKSKSYAARGVFLTMIGARNRKTPDGRRPSKYLHLVEAGAVPHIIRPKKARAIAFSADGRTVVLSGDVGHPGMTGQRPIARGFRASRDQARRAFSEKLAVEVEKEARKA